MTSARPDAAAVLDAPDDQDRGPRSAATQRIAFVVSAFDEGPGGNAASAWTSFFADAGSTVEAVALGRSRSGAVPASVPIWRLGRERVLARKTRALAKLFDERRYDVVVAIGTMANVAAVGGRRRSAHQPILVLAEQDLLSLNAATGSLRAMVRAWLARRRYRHADAVISPSHAVAAEIAAAFGVPSSRSLVVPNPALRSSASISADGASTWANRVPREPGTAGSVQLVLLSPLTPEKNPQLAIRTAKVLSGRGIAADVVALEGGPLSDQLSELAASLGVRFTSLAGSHDPFASIGPRAVALLTSPREGAGDDLVRAAAQGMPSVAISTALGVADGIIPGVTGELALDDDPDSVADAVVTAASLSVQDVDEWLGRFATESSGKLLAEVIAYASAGRG